MIPAWLASESVLSLSITKVDAWIAFERRLFRNAADRPVAVLPIKKVQDDQQVVYGWGSVAVTGQGQQVTDLQGDQIDPDTLEASVTDLMLGQGNHGGTGVMHEGLPVGDIIASLVTTPDIVAAFFPGAKDVPVGWIVGVHVSDPKIWAAIKSGELKAFSIQGVADRVDAQEAA